MNKIGITGGIGSGKTTIAHFFEILNIPVYLSDERAKNLMLTDAVLITQIKALLGEEAYYSEGGINKSYIADKIFNQPALLKAMNALVHPAVERDFETFCKEHSTSDYVLKESAVLFETGIYKNMDANILVTAPESERIERVQKRSNLSRSKVEQRISKQWSDAQKKPLSDYLIINDNRQLIIPQILDIHACLKDLA